MPFEVDKTYAFKSTSTQYSDILILSFLSGTFLEAISEKNPISIHLTFVVKADMALMAIWLSVTVTWRVADTWKEPGSAVRHVF